MNIISQSSTCWAAIQLLQTLVIFVKTFNMSSATSQIFCKLLEFIACFSALLTKKLTDTQAQRVMKRNQKMSNEWRLLNNLSWSPEGDDFSIVIYGGYSLITAILLISKIFGRMKKTELCEKLLLTFGVFCFLVEGCLVYISVEQIPQELYINAFILGSLSLLVATLFLIDICCLGKTKKLGKACQTDLPPIKHIQALSAPPIATHATHIRNELQGSHNKKDIECSAIYTMSSSVDQTLKRTSAVYGNNSKCSTGNGSVGKKYLTTEI